MNTWQETVIYYKGKLKNDSKTILKALRFSVEVMLYTDYSATHIGFEDKNLEFFFGEIKKEGKRAEKYIESIKEPLDSLNIFSILSGKIENYFCIQFRYEIKNDYLMFSFNSEIAEELEIERIAYIMKQMMDEITEGEIFRVESSREISGYVSGIYDEKELEWKEVIYDLIEEFELIENVVEDRDKEWGDIIIEDLIN